MHAGRERERESRDSETSAMVPGPSSSGPPIHSSLSKFRSFSCVVISVFRDLNDYRRTWIESSYIWLLAHTHTHTKVRIMIVT